MKKFYETPNIEVISCMGTDIVTASRSPLEDGGDQDEYEKGIKWEDLFA